MAAPAPIYRGQGNIPFRSERFDAALKRGQSSPYDLNGAPTGGAAATRVLPLSFVDLSLASVTKPLLRVQLTENWQITSTVASCGVAPTADAVFTFKEGGVTIGTVTFLAGATTGTASFSDSSVASGSIFEVYPPNPGDATLDLVSITLALTVS